MYIFQDRNIEQKIFPRFRINLSH